MRPSGNQALIDALAIEIKTRRAVLGISQEELAGRAELDRPYISMIEVGRKQPTLSVLYRVAMALGLTLQELARRIEERHEAQARRAEAGAKGGM